MVYLPTCPSVRTYVRRRCFGTHGSERPVKLKFCVRGCLNIRNRLDSSVFVFQMPFLQKFANNYCIWLGSTVICKFSAPRQVLRGPRAVVLRRFCVILRCIAETNVLFETHYTLFIINDGHIVFHWDEREYVHLCVFRRWQKYVMGVDLFIVDEGKLLCIQNKAK